MQNKSPPNKSPPNKSPPSQGPPSQIALSKYTPMQKIKGIAECIYKICHFEESISWFWTWGSCMRKEGLLAENKVEIRQYSGPIPAKMWCKFAWSDLRDGFYMISFLIECLLTKFHQVPNRNAQVMANWKCRYRQLFGKSGWLVKKCLDRYQTLQLHAET